MSDDKAVPEVSRDQWFREAQAFCHEVLHSPEHQEAFRRYMDWAHRPSPIMDAWFPKQ